MKRHFRIFVGVFLFLVFGDSAPLRGQNQPVPPVPDYICEPAKGYNPAMCFTAGDGDPQGPLGARIPVILIHGWNPKEIAGEPDLSVWNGLGSYFWESPWFRERFKMYFLVYLSNIQGYTIRDMGLSFRSLVERMDATDPAFATKPLVMIGHSMGGLIARSYMQEFRRGSGGRNGDRVLRLITLATPHHGTPLANGPSRDVKAGFEAFLLHQFVDGGLFGYDIRWDMHNRYDLHWDNYDGYFDFEYKSFPENSLWMEWLNSGETFERKIVAYGGKVSRLSQIGDCVFGAKVAACLAAIMNRTLGISESDGFVPLKSAFFDPCKDCIATRVFDGYDHSEIVRGKFRAEGEVEPLFESIANDLSGLVVAPDPNVPVPNVPAPVVRSVSVSPSGVGLENATQFTFSLDTNALPSQSTFVWDFGDGSTAIGTTAATHVFTYSGSFTVRAMVTNAAGQVTTSITVRVASMVGSWFVAISGHAYYPRVPITWVELRLNQPLPNSINSLTPLSASWNDSAGCRAGASTENPYLYGSVDHPRSISVGIEHFYCNYDGDFHLHGIADSEVRVITGSCPGGGPNCRFTMTRRR